MYDMIYTYIWWLVGDSRPATVYKEKKMAGYRTNKQTTWHTHTCMQQVRRDENASRTYIHDDDE